MENLVGTEFRSERSLEALGMAEAVDHARAAITTLTSSELDAVSLAEEIDDHSWRVELDVVESAARLGDNDLLCAYEVRIAPNGKLLGFRRLRRYHRESGDAA
ncbi:MAG: gas vesicle protein GvpO [Pseudomonadota bacterium]